MKKYNLLYARKTAILTLCIFIPLGVLYFLIWLAFDSPTEDLITIFVSLGFMLAAVCLWCAIRMLYATVLYRKQIDTLRVAPPDGTAKPLYPSSLIFLSESWLIMAGKLYLHRDFIQQVSVKIRRTSKGNDYFCVFRCLDRTVKTHIPSASEAKKIKKWFDAGEQASTVCFTKKSPK